MLFNLKMLCPIRVVEMYCHGTRGSSSKYWVVNPYSWNQVMNSCQVIVLVENLDKSTDPGAEFTIMWSQKFASGHWGRLALV